MAYISKAEVTEIRNALKAKYGKRFKFSVRKSDPNSSLSVTVSILSGDVDFSDIVGSTGGMQGHAQINHYHLGNYGEFSGLFGEILNVIKSAPANAEGGRAHFDKSRAEVDYFCTAFYINMEIGRYGKPMSTILRRSKGLSCMYRNG